MTDYKVPCTEILEILEHPNADRLQIAKVFGFYIVVGKDSFNVGDKVIYIAIDSVIPEDLEEILFPPYSQIKLTKRRIKQIRIRKFASQGMLLSINNANELLKIRKQKPIDWKLEENYANNLGIIKYEPPAPKFQGITGNSKQKSKENPFFKKYGGIENYKWFPNLFKENEEVIVTEKIHGTHVRFGWAPFVANTLWKKIKMFFGYAPKWEWVYGSNNTQLQERNGYYGADIYGKTLEKYNAMNKVPKGFIVHGEIYGSGIQKNYNYGCKEGEHKLIIFDIKLFINGSNNYEYRDFWIVQEFGKTQGFDVVPVLYEGPFNYEKMKELTLGNSVLIPSQKVREGIVIKNVEGNRKVLKLISEKYLDKEQTDFH